MRQDHTRHGQWALQLLQRGTRGQSLQRPRLRRSRLRSGPAHRHPGLLRRLRVALGPRGGPPLPPLAPGQLREERPDRTGEGCRGHARRGARGRARGAFRRPRRPLCALRFHGRVPRALLSRERHVGWRGRVASCDLRDRGDRRGHMSGARRPGAREHPHAPRPLPRGLRGLAARGARRQACPRARPAQQGRASRLAGTGRGAPALLWALGHRELRPLATRRRRRPRRDRPRARPRGGRAACHDRPHGLRRLRRGSPRRHPRPRHRPHAGGPRPRALDSPRQLTARWRFAW